MPKRRPATPLRTAREYERGAFVTEASAVIFAALRAAKPDASERERDKLVAAAVEDAETLHRMLVKLGHRP